MALLRNRRNSQFLFIRQKKRKFYSLTVWLSLQAKIQKYPRIFETKKNKKTKMGLIFFCFFLFGNDVNFYSFPNGKNPFMVCVRPKIEKFTL